MRFERLSKATEKTFNEGRLAITFPERKALVIAQNRDMQEFPDYSRFKTELPPVLLLAITGPPKELSSYKKARPLYIWIAVEDGGFCLWMAYESELDITKYWDIKKQLKERNVLMEKTGY